MIKEELISWKFTTKIKENLRRNYENILELSIPLFDSCAGL